jgi:glyoxylase-like metal-dependent hydrolase (beta-lactamase superfamily II)
MTGLLISMRMTLPTTTLAAYSPQLMALTIPSYSFLVEHPSSGRRVLFDLAIRKDYETLPPAVQKFLIDVNWVIEMEKDVVDILAECGIKSGDIEAVILSHHHFDHVGDMTRFPLATDLVVGPGFKNAYQPGFPVNQQSTLLETDWQEREMREVSFKGSKVINIGGYESVDYFGDGSFYLLNTPGHTVGHLAGLARVTVEGERDTFVLMGGDTCAIAGQIRPNIYRPLPVDIIPNPFPHAFTGSCPGAAIMENLHPLHCGDKPLVNTPQAVMIDLPAAQETLQKLEGFDGADNVFVVIAHDHSLLGNVDVFPKRINDWKEKDIAQKARWKFLASFNLHSDQSG